MIKEKIKTDPIIGNLSIIAKRYGIKEFIKVEPGDHLCECNGEDVYKNASYIIGNDTIQLGIYEELELMIASFFHELGHVTDNTDWSIETNNKTQYLAEEKAWELGFKLAKKYGYSFSDNTYKWAKEQLETYLK